MENLASKKELTSQELQLLASEMDKRKKSTATTWLLWFFLGNLGVHRYYLGKIGTGVAMTFTLGGLGLWTLIDLFLINGMIQKKNGEVEQQVISELRSIRATGNKEAAATVEG
ncbi:TM2 domain-containing protein [Litchfieldia salsa]|uniref:TM2 domain-containing protein n=1 Tax=Litchfieldia salsa TaxID=930152 RepID=A0A1H0W5F2_9BACI|nr:TM2 domain-containing protein [Litchfieldia salsa]SDP85701.1 TM2 domain-containing protein [Litchfieldia salsa]